MSAVDLPAGSTVGKSYEYGLDVNLGTYSVPMWQPFRRISGFQPTDTPTTNDAQTYDDLGAANQDVTGWSWALAFLAQVNRSLATGLYLPEVEYLLARAGKPSAKGEAAVADIRWYHKPESGTPNPNDAGRGLCTVSKTRQNTGPNGEIEQIAFNLTGKGPYEQITNPFAGWDVAEPIVGSVAPAAAGDGELVTITGSGFLGATAVSIGTTAEFSVINGATIIAIMPIGDAGSVDVTVTTPGGTSAALAYTRGA